MQETIHDIDIKLLRIFRVVAKQKSFSLAANALNTSPSNISMNMTQLESRLQMRLCERGVKGFKLTAEGQKVLDASNELYGAMQKFREQVGTVAESSQSEFRIGVLSETIFDNHIKVSGILADLEASQPDISFYLEFSTAIELRNSIQEEKLHCAVAYFSNLPSSFVSRPLYRETHLCYCGAKHPLFDMDDESINMKLLQKYRIAGYDDMAEEEKRVVPLFDKYDSCSRTNEGILTLILSGNYVGLLPEHYARPWVDKGVIRVIDREELELSVDIELIYKKSRVGEPVLKSLLDSMNRFYPV